jgi:hypothetical protein
MPTNNQIKVIVGLVLVLWFAVHMAQGNAHPPNLLTEFSYVVTGVSIAFLAWERWIWSWPIVRTWLTKRPNLKGTWRGQLVSTWTGPKPENWAGPIDVYLVVRQTYSSIDVRMFSLEMDSVSLSADIVADVSGVQTLAITYRSTPKVLLRSGSPIHYGGMLLSIRGAPIYQLDGEYWTDRETKGQAAFLARAPNLSHDYNGAASQRFRALVPPR